VTLVLGSLINMRKPGRYIHWGFIQISVANAVLIVLMVLVFIAAIAIPYRHRKGGH
jgi:heme/copper-type cytochrome/quinol oxidase subunit 2